MNDDEIISKITNLSKGGKWEYSLEEVKCAIFLTRQSEREKIINQLLELKSQLNNHKETAQIGTCVSQETKYPTEFATQEMGGKSPLNQLNKTPDYIPYAYRCPACCTMLEINCFKDKKCPECSCQIPDENILYIKVHSPDASNPTELENCSAEPSGLHTPDTLKSPLELIEEIEKELNECCRKDGCDKCMKNKASAKSILQVCEWNINSYEIESITIKGMEILNKAIEKARRIING